MPALYQARNTHTVVPGVVKNAVDWHLARIRATLNR